jgi:integrase
MTRIKLAYVHAFIDRHGRARHYFRRRGLKPVPLPGLPGSAEFMDAYRMALETREETARVEIGAIRSLPGTVAAALSGYYGSLDFANLAEGTRRERRRILEHFRVEHGDKRLAFLKREHIEKMIAAKSSTPGAAANFLVAIQALLRYAIAVGLRTDDPTIGIRRPKIRSAGIYTWTEQDIAAFEAFHPIGSRARLALALLLYTAQRRSDVVTLGRQHIRDGVIHIRQRKTGNVLQIPIHPELQLSLDAMPAENLTFLVNYCGKPLTPGAFAVWFRRECSKAGVPKCASVHGLRKAACRRLAEAGCSEKEISAISGHLSLREVARYTRAADQARMARSAISAMPGRTEPEQKIGKPRIEDGKPDDKSRKIQN